MIILLCYNIDTAYGCSLLLRSHFELGEAGIAWRMGITSSIRSSAASSYSSSFSSAASVLARAELTDESSHPSATRFVVQCIGDSLNAGFSAVYRPYALALEPGLRACGLDAACPSRALSGWTAEALLAEARAGGGLTALLASRDRTGLVVLLVGINDFGLPLSAEDSPSSSTLPNALS